jgi:hypothetical protein
VYASFTSEALVTPPSRGPSRGAEGPLRVGLVLGGFPSEKATAFKYFLLLLNRLQRTFEFEFYDPPAEDPLMGLLRSKDLLDANSVREKLPAFANRLRQSVDRVIQDFELAVTWPTQIIIVSLATLSNYHFLIRREKVSLLALGEWERSMAPPSAAEFVQVLVLRAAYSALQGAVWNSIHAGTRGCVFDFTDNLEDSRLMALAGIGVCSECAAALSADGHGSAAQEIQTVVQRAWLGDRKTPGTPAAIMASLGYDLYLTKGFTPTWRERLAEVLREDVFKGTINLIFALMLAALVLVLGLKK